MYSTVGYSNVDACKTTGVKLLRKVEYRQGSMSKDQELVTT